MLRVWAASGAELAAVTGEELCDARSLTLCTFGRLSKLWSLVGSLLEYGTYYLGHPRRDPSFENHPFRVWGLAIEASPGIENCELVACKVLANLLLCW